MLTMALAYGILSEHVCLPLRSCMFVPLRSSHRLPDFGRKPRGVIKEALSLCLITHHTVKVYGGVEVYLHAFVTSELGGGPWSASPPRPALKRQEVEWSSGQVWTL